MSEKFDPEERKEIEKQRTISDAELLKGGAEYEVDEKGNKRLEVADKQINNIKMTHENEIEAERRHLLYEHVQQQEFKRGDKIKIRFLPVEVINKGENDLEDFKKMGWSYISPELTRHGIKTGDERIFYLTTEPVYSDCMIASVIPPEQLEGMAREEMAKNLVTLWYREIESADKIEN